MINYRKVLVVFEENYVLVPLEIFGSDPYKTLISTLMSARTNDDTTLDSSKRLFKKAPNFNSLNKLSEKEISELIFPVGFYKTKAKHIKLLAKKIMTDYNGKVPSTREELMTLPGVGRKTANLVLNRAFGHPAIAVDTHVHRISNILGWVNTKTPQETEAKLIETVPEELWTDMNRLFVSIGRQYRSERQVKEFLKSQGLLK